MGKRLVGLDNEKSKAKEVLFVEGLNKNVLCLSKMVDNINDITFSYKGCKMRKNSVNCSNNN
jgi:hypothetical protein